MCIRDRYAVAIRSALPKETFDPTKLSVDSYIQQTEHPVVDILKDYRHLKNDQDLPADDHRFTRSYRRQRPR